MSLFAVLRNRKHFRRDSELDASECIITNWLTNIILKKLRGYK
jgi:hypothetical protein